MYKHHQTAIDTITNKLKTKEEIIGIIIGGSVAHGYANETSDIDIMIVLSNEDYEKALVNYDVGYFERDSTPYEGGYVDGKCVSVDFITKVAKYGSEPARFAFKDAFVTYSAIEGLDTLVQDASRYPVEKKEESISKFYAQFETWRWYYYEGLKRDNRLLMDYSITNYIYFAGRLILALNETLFPSYKWFLKELEQVDNKPEHFMLIINDCIENKTTEAIEKLYNSMIEFHKWNTSDKHWSIHFMMDSQLNWVDGAVPIIDL